MRRAAFAGFCLLALAMTLACGSGGHTATATYVPPTPEPTTPADKVLTTLDGTCHLSDVGARLVVTYSVRTEGNAHLSRIQLSVNNRVVFDTGPIDERQYDSATTIFLPPGGLQVLRLTASAAFHTDTTATGLVRCPAAPANPHV